MAESENSLPVVVCDAGPLIHLDEVGSIALLADFPQVIVPTTVWEEVNRHRPSALATRAVKFLQTTTPKTSSAELETLSRLLTLHRGELDALQIVETHSECLLLTDDTAARLAAGNLRISTHGTIGILIRAIRRKQKTKSEVLTLLHSLPIASTLHIQASLLNDIIRQVEQS